MKFQYIIFFCALLFYSATAYFSSGYIHPDEHYQIIEFAGILNGSNTSKDMAWEYFAQIRPTIQPVICYLVFQACECISIFDPYSKAFILRLLTGFFAVGSIYYFTNSYKSSIPLNYWNAFLILSYFLWFLPFINVRFSSETWSGLLLLLAIAIIKRSDSSYKTYLLLGILLGGSFLFRFQIAFAGIGLILWLVIIQKESILKIGTVLLSGSMILLLGFFIDSFFYGNWVITPLEYFKVNLIQGKAAEFGTEPWYGYIVSIYRNASPIIAIFLYVTFIIVLLKKYNNIIIWAIVPFLIGHSIIAHKEVRFLFPLVNLIPIIVIMAIEILSIETWNRFVKSIVYVLLLIISLINIVALILANTVSAGNGVAKITNEIHKLKADKLNVFYINGWNPYYSWGLRTPFYEESNVTYITLESVVTNEIRIEHDHTTNVLVVHREDVDNLEVQKLIQTLHLKETCKSVPDYMVSILDYYYYNTNHMYVMYAGQ